MSLTSCIKKAGALLHPEDKLAILDRVRELKAEGMKAGEAGKQAVQEQLTNVRGLLESPEKSIKPAESDPLPFKVGEKEGEATPEQSAQSQRVAQLALENPDQMVTIPGHEPMKLSEAMEAAQAEAAEAAKSTSLVQAALECALSL